MVRVSTLLAEAAAAGLTVRAGVDRLVIRGPRGCEALANALLERRAKVMALLVLMHGEASPRTGPEVQPQIPPNFSRGLDDGGEARVGALGYPTALRCRWCRSAK